MKDYKKLFEKQKQDNILLATENVRLENKVKELLNEVKAYDTSFDNHKLVIQQKDAEIIELKKQIEGLEMQVAVKMGNYHGALAAIKTMFN